MNVEAVSATRRSPTDGSLRSVSWVELTRRLHAQVMDLGVEAYKAIKALARETIAALQSHCIQLGSALMPSASMSGPNGLTELAAHVPHVQASGNSNTLASSDCSPDNQGLMIRSITGVDSTPDRQWASETSPDSLNGADTGMVPDHTLTAKRRLKARLHLEVLRVLLWCFNVLDFKLEIQPEANIPYISV